MQDDRLIDREGQRAIGVLWKQDVYAFGRGERHCPATTDLPVTMRLAEPPEPCEWLRSA